MGRIIVVGSANIDVTLEVAELPGAGETVLSSSRRQNVGGKGSNQAAAAALLGATTSFLACVGDDEGGRSVLDDLQGQGVSVEDVEILGGVGTGLAIVTVSSTGENSIVVSQGANEKLSAQRVEAVLSREAREGTVVVLQAEIPLETMTATVQRARELDCVVVLNLAPFCRLPADVLGQVDVLVVNEVEGGALLRDVRLIDEDCQEAARRLAQLVRGAAVITVGSKGAYWAERQGAGAHTLAPSTKAVDTTGAGDAFVGALACAFSQGWDVEAAVDLGVRVGSFAVQKEGTQASYPRGSEVGLVTMASAKGTTQELR